MASSNGDSERRNRRDDGDESDDIIFFGEEAMEESIRSCHRSLIGRILADRSFSIGTVVAALGAIWGHPAGFKVMDLGDNKFHFFFYQEVDVIRIEKGGPWLFKNYIVNLKRWTEAGSDDHSDLTLVPIWIQFWGIPEHYKSKNLVSQIASRVGEVLEVDFFAVRGREIRILKAKRTCSTLLEDSVAGRVQEEKWGIWLKADQGGKRWSVDNKENANPNQPRIDSTLKQNQQRPTPENQIELLGVTNPKNSTAIVDDQQKDNSLADLSDGDNLAITCNGQSMEGKVGEIMGDANASFCFGQSSPPKSQGRRKIQLKQLARRNANQGLTKSGEKRAMEIMEVAVSKKQCVEGENEAEMGMGAYPKMAPKGI
ncbi:hypothetical protein PIB30_042738 [Stylosanthes scabra]|uniref:DUF4283 domain-containing protein n=1 Tax=Stylosanthes scabra TaxID=79078 RepID=A0ABU6RFX3_9FABA|nr:hypothetical protein [Stylosanthes scabra]